MTGAGAGKVTKAQAFGDLAEPCVLHRDGSGTVQAVQIGGKRLVSEADHKAEISGRYTSIG